MDARRHGVLDSVEDYRNLQCNKYKFIYVCALSLSHVMRE